MLTLLHDSINSTKFRGSSNFMDHQLMTNSFNLTTSRRRKKLILALAAFGFTGYGAYRVYNLPSVVHKRNRLLKFLQTLVSIAEAVSNSVEVIGVVSKDLNTYLKSDSDHIPNSLNQVSKIFCSCEFSESVVKVTRGLTMGVIRGYRSETIKNGDGMKGGSSFLDRVMNKLSTPAGSGFASVVVGSFAKNLVMGVYSEKQSAVGSNGEADSDSVSRWVNVVCDEKCRLLISNCVQLFVSTAVSVYLEKTMDINTYDELFAGMTNPSHNAKVRDLFVSVTNGAVRTLIKTSHEVFENSDSSNHSDSDQCPEPTMNGDTVGESPSGELRGGSKTDGMGGKMASILSVSSNRRFVLDITGRVVFETVASFLQFILDKLTEGLKRGFEAVNEAVIERSIECFRYVTQKSSAIFSVCLSLCLHILNGPWVLVPAY